MKDINLAGNSKEAIDFLGNTLKYDCMGCALANHQITPPGGIIYETENFLINPDPEVPINGFLIVNVKKHLNSIIELTKNEQIELISLINLAIKALKDLGITNEVTIVQEERSRHLHVWIVPNHEWMVTKFGKGVTHLRDIFTYAQENATEEDKKEILNSIAKIKKYIDDNTNL